MAAISSTNLSNALKTLYIGQKMNNLVFNKKSRPFLSKVKKNGNFQGGHMPIPVMYSDVAGGSSTFSKAQANIGAPSLEKFEIDVKTLYRVVQVNTKALRKSKSDLGTFLSAQVVKFDSAINAMSNDLERQLFRTSSAEIGTIDASVDTNTLVCPLANDGESKNFQVGDDIVAADTVASSLRSSTSMTVSAVDHANNQITFGDGTNLGTQSWAAGDLLFREGDYVSASDTLHISGLEDWIPTSVASSGDSFFGVDRYPARESLAGVYKSDGDLQNIRSSILSLATQMADYNGAAPDTLLINFPLWAQLADEMDIDVRRDPMDGKGGFKSLWIAAPGGMIEVLPCTFCQANTGWLLTMKTWTLWSMGDPVGIYSDDGQMAQRVYNADALETRICSYPQLACNLPGHNGRILFA